MAIVPDHYAFERSCEITASTVHTAAAPADFDSRIDAIGREFAGLWAAAPASMPELGPRVGWQRQWGTAREAARLIDSTAAEIHRSLRSSEDWAVARAALRLRIEQFGRARLGWPTGACAHFASDSFYKATATFLRDAEAFDAGIPVDQLCQALRNVWVGNSLQWLLDRPMDPCPALFAYSLLYPVTDNWLDDPSASAEEKCAFNARLGERLSGLPVLAENDREARAYRLVQRIEGALPRARFPYVYSSLLAIHAGQCRSLEQHRGEGLTDSALLEISVAKGGTSVLTNLFLIGGRDDASAMRFAFGYGVALQLLDDLQDVERDLAAGHETLFTRAARRRALDEAAARLARFIDLLLADVRFPGQPEYRERLDLIRRHCITLLVDSVAVHRARFSRGWLRYLARHWPVSLRAQARLSRRTARLAHGVASSLRVQTATGQRPERLDEHLPARHTAT